MLTQISNKAILTSQKNKGKTDKKWERKQGKHGANGKAAKR